MKIMSLSTDYKLQYQSMWAQLDTLSTRGNHRNAREHEYLSLCL